MSGFVREMRTSGNGMLVRVSMIAAIGGLLFGYDTGVISGALLYLKDDLHAGPLAQQWIVSSLLLGAILGAVLSGYLADAISRKWTKVISGTVYVLGAIGCALAVNVPMLIGFRFILGLAVGTASFVAPLYISEVSPPKVRGGLVSFNQLAITSGILLAYLVNFAFKGVTDNWRWMLGVAVIPGAALAVGMLTVPHTPRWLMDKGREDEARTVLERLRRGDPDANVDKEIEDIKEANDRERSSTVRDLAKERLRPLLWVGLGLTTRRRSASCSSITAASSASAEQGPSSPSMPSPRSPSTTCTSTTPATTSHRRLPTTLTWSSTATTTTRSTATTGIRRTGSPATRTRSYPTTSNFGLSTARDACGMPRTEEAANGRLNRPGATTETPPPSPTSTRSMQKCGDEPTGDQRAPMAGARSVVPQRDPARSHRTTCPPSSTPLTAWRRPPTRRNTFGGPGSITGLAEVPHGIGVTPLKVATPLQARLVAPLKAVDDRPQMRTASVGWCRSA